MQELEKPDVLFLYNFYGLPTKRVGSSIRSNVCPACGANSDKSHKVILNPDIWHCFRCGSYGNGYEIIKLLENLEFKEAAKRWKEIIGNDVGEIKEKIIKIKRVYKEKSDEEKEKEFHLKKELIRQILRYKIENDYKNTRAYDYLISKRKIKSEIIEAYLNKKFFIVDTLKILNCPKVEKLCEELRINKFMFKTRELIFPFWDLNNKGIGAEFRSVDPNPNYPKTISIGKKLSQIWQDGKFYNILLVEGFMDALAARQMNWKGDILIVPGTSHAKDAAKLLKKFKYKKIYTAFDADEAGIIASQKFKEIIKKAKALKLPPESDLNDILGKIENILDILPESFWDKFKRKLKIA